MSVWIEEGLLFTFSPSMRRLSQIHRIKAVATEWWIQGTLFPSLQDCHNCCSFSIASTLHSRAIPQIFQPSNNCLVFICGPLLQEESASCALFHYFARSLIYPFSYSPFFLQFQGFYLDLSLMFEKHYSNSISVSVLVVNSQGFLFV